jgi:hypothetical protein
MVANPLMGMKRQAMLKYDISHFTATKSAIWLDATMQEVSSSLKTDRCGLRTNDLCCNAEYNGAESLTIKRFKQCCIAVQGFRDGLNA